MLRRTALLSASLGLLPAALPAQSALTVEVKAATPYGNFAREGSRQDFRSLPVGAPIPRGTSSIGANTGNAFADTILGWNTWPGDVVTVDVSEQGGGAAGMLSGTTASTSASSVQQGPHGLRLKIRGAPGLRGKVEVWGSGIAFAGTAATLQADVGDDNTVDFQLAVAPTGSFARSQWRVALDANGELAVRITTDARAAPTTGNAVYKVGISVRFTPGSFCDMIGYGPSCGPGLSGSDAVSGPVRELTLQVGDAPASSPGVLVVGGQRLDVPIPGTRCRLLTDVAVALPITTGSGGTAQVLLRVPFAAATGGNFQAAVVGAGGLVTTNAVAVGCR